MTRKNLILSVADQDGGAHIDPTLNSAYAKLSRPKMLRWSAHDSSGFKLEIGRPELAAVRQIAHEVLTSLEKVTGVKPPITQPELSASFSDFRLTAELVEPREMQSAKRKIGRNEPCPCGSGLKYKKCHLGK